MKEYSPFVSVPYFSIVILSFKPEFMRTRREGSRIPGGTDLESSIIERGVDVFRSAREKKVNKSRKVTEGSTVKGIPSKFFDLLGVSKLKSFRRCPCTSVISWTIGKLIPKSDESNIHFRRVKYSRKSKTVVL
jgi:hypothetical protein